MNSPWDQPSTESRPDVSIAFRQHPCEKIPAYRSKEDYSWISERKEAYFDLIEKSIRNPTFEQLCSAYAEYYVAENFGLHRTNFTPIPSDFEIWVDQDPTVLWSKDRALIFLQAALSRKPAADLLVEALFEKWAPQLGDSKR